MKIGDFVISDPAIDELQANELYHWLCEGASPHHSAHGIVGGMCEKLVEAGVPLSRLALFIFTIHPTIRGRRVSWSPEEGAVTASAGYEVFQSEIYHNNPIPVVLETKKSIRRKLVDPDCPRDYIIIDELLEEGFTDYLITPLVYLSGEVHCVSWSSRAPQGFSSKAIELMEKISHPLARLSEIYMLRLNSATLLSTYVGRDAGDKVMAGQVKLGDGEDIQAAILFADIKGFTSLSNRMTANNVLQMLNLFFAALEKPINSHHGEILKFMGDGVLAIFPVSDEDIDESAAVTNAFSSLREARTIVEKESRGELSFRASIHNGKIHYGNIGGERRLDFTAIGSSVNLGARLLGAATDLDSNFVCSKSAAEYLKNEVGLPTEFIAKGFDTPQLVYSLELTE
ncbi:MAG: adenylate/guanylate cyclase domain-containing protein [Hyphomicrobiales bacterium]|nr:adenylate/guanylate cyclase domain-containing protein [Hyphomicrobiales bacterium]